MNYKDMTFELDGGEIELEIQWSYYHNPGKYYGRPEDCYPEEEEMEVLPPTDLNARVKAFAEKMIPVWIKQIESKCQDMEFDNLPSEWSKEDYKEAV